MGLLWGSKEPDKPLHPKIADLAARMLEAEERLDYLEGALKKLRGKMYGGERSNPVDSPEPEPEVQNSEHLSVLPRKRNLRGF